MCEDHAAKFLGGFGIDANTDVIVYDKGAGANASGNWFLLKLYGHDKVRILDGGIASWTASGGPVEGGAPAKPAAKSFKPSVRWDMIASLDEVKAATEDPSKYMILDARHKLDEYTGSSLKEAMKSPGEEIVVARGGHIPGAVFSPWTKYAGNKKNEAGLPTFQETSRLEKQVARLERKGYAPDKTIISYCHVGLGRGSFQYMALKRAKHDKVKVYMGSWSEWGNTDDLPVAVEP
jgi:thiosulfate/3-mercaptopyruvate sulfurtransferase